MLSEPVLVALAVRVSEPLREGLRVAAALVLLLGEALAEGEVEAEALLVALLLWGGLDEGGREGEVPCERLPV